MRSIRSLGKRCRRPREASRHRRPQHKRARPGNRPKDGVCSCRPLRSCLRTGRRTCPRSRRRAGAIPGRRGPLRWPEPLRSPLHCHRPRRTCQSGALPSPQAAGSAARFRPFPGRAKAISIDVRGNAPEPGSLPTARCRYAASRQSPDPVAARAIRPMSPATAFPLAGEAIGKCPGGCRAHDGMGRPGAWRPGTADLPRCGNSHRALPREDGRTLPCAGPACRAFATVPAEEAGLSAPSCARPDPTGHPDAPDPHLPGDMPAAASGGTIGPDLGPEDEPPSFSGLEGKARRLRRRDRPTAASRRTDMRAVPGGASPCRRLALPYRPSPATKPVCFPAAFPGSRRHFSRGTMRYRSAIASAPHPR